MAKKTEKIVITDFVTNKQLEKIDSIISRGRSVHDACDDLEKLFKGTDLITLDGGTNRLIFTHQELKGVIFKIAADKHGIEANYREFHVSDLDKRITNTYSISDNGTIIVAERVKRIRTQAEADNWKKEIVKMLWKLHKKFLLVDCKVSNFKNFGLKKIDGEMVPVLLDAGDIVTLEHMQSFNTEVNFDEEINVSLRCRRVKGGKHKEHQCKGTLIPNDAFDSLTCDKCGAVHTFYEAYTEFILDAAAKKKKNSGNFIGELNEDKLNALEEERVRFEQHQNNVSLKYAEQTMKGAVSMNKVNKDFSTYTIIDGYAIPEPGKDIQFGSMHYSSVLLGKTKPVDYFAIIKVNPDDWKVDNTPTKSTSFEHIKSHNNQLPPVTNQPTKPVDKIEIKQVKTDNTRSGVSSRQTCPTFSRRPEEQQSNRTNSSGRAVITPDVCVQIKPATTNAVDVTERDKSYNDSSLISFIIGLGEELSYKQTNLLHILNRDVNKDAVDLSYVGNIWDSQLSIKMYSALLTVIDTVYCVDEETELPEVINTLYPIIVDLQDAVWQEYANCVNNGRVDRYKIHHKFTEEWIKLVNSFRVLVSSGKVKLSEFKIVVEDYILDSFIEGMDITEEEYTQLFIDAPNEVIETPKLTVADYTSKGVVTPMTTDVVSSAEQNTTTTTHIESEKVRSYGKNDDMLSTIREAVDELIDVYGKESFMAAITKYTDMVEKKPNIVDLVDVDGNIPVTLSSLKNKSIVVAWVETGSQKETRVLIDIYEHIMRNANELDRDGLNIASMVYINPWDGDVEPYDEAYGNGD